MCPNCDVTLTYHRSDRPLVCHYCNHRELAPSQCLVCGSKFIYYVGEGTEQIDELLRRRFPELRIGRIDRDTKSRRHAFEKTLLDFSKGELDLLVRTQMLAKGHDFPNVTLVGVISVDAGLALPDFRAAERAFQLITQVAGRAGRGDKAGRVLIQTYHPQNYALRHASAQDYRGFYEEEIRHRRNHGYPPFVALALLLLRQQAAGVTWACARRRVGAGGIVAAGHGQVGLVVMCTAQTRHRVGRGKADEVPTGQEKLSIKAAGHRRHPCQRQFIRQYAILRSKMQRY